VKYKSLSSALNSVDEFSTSLNALPTCSSIAVNEVVYRFQYLFAAILYYCFKFNSIILFFYTKLLKNIIKNIIIVKKNLI
jgi:hypothetical protein